MLQFFEGEGAPFKQNLYEKMGTDPNDTFEKTFCLLASNKLPYWAMQSKHPELFEKQWKPLMTRVEMVVTNTSYAECM